MKKSEMFDVLASKVCEVCEVRLEHVLKGSKLQAVVDARMLLVQYLKRIGLSSDDIALIVLRRASGETSSIPDLTEIKHKAKGIDNLFNSYSRRCMESYAFCLMSVDIRNFCRESYKELYVNGMKELPM